MKTKRKNSIPNVSEEKLKKILPKVKEGESREKKKYEKLSFWQKRKLKKKPESSFLIKMHFSNGTSKEFVVSTKNELFEYMNRNYYLRYENSWFNLTQNQYELLFFDDHPVPLDREIVKNGDNAYWSVSPDNLKPLIKMEYIKALASSQEIDKYLRMASTLSVLTLFICLGVLYFIFKINKAIVGLV